MKQNVIASLPALSLLAPFAAAGAESGAYDPTAAEKYIVDAEAAWAESVASGDASVVKRILADDVVWVLDGRVLTKSQAVVQAAAETSPASAAQRAAARRRVVVACAESR